MLSPLRKMRLAIETGGFLCRVNVQGDTWYSKSCQANCLVIVWFHKLEIYIYNIVTFKGRKGDMYRCASRCHVEIDRCKL